MIRKRVAVLISGRGSNMISLIEAAKAPAYPAEITLVISNRPQAAGLARAAAEGVPTMVIDHRPHGQDRAAFERLLQNALEEQRIELVCLGGFMRLFTPAFAEHWRGRMINIHPALLPAFRGLDPHRQALEAGVKISGATVHFVVPDTDAGPIIAQEPSLSAKTTMPRRSPRACSQSSIASILRRSNSWPRDASGSSTAVASSMGFARPKARCWFRRRETSPPVCTRS